jgi:ABC-2 type transport system permease protein
MRKIGHIAAREFIATVATRGFVVGLLIMPTMIGFMAITAPRLFGQSNFRVQGQIAIVDPTGVVAAELRKAVDPAAIAARRAEDARRTLDAAPPAIREMAGGAAESSRATGAVLGPIPQLTVVERPASGDPQHEKGWLNGAEPDEARHLALAVVHPHAVTPPDGGTAYGTYDLYVPAGLDERIQTVIQQNLREAIVAARARALGVDRRQIDALMRVDRVLPVTVTRDGDRRSAGAFNQALPFVFAGLLVFGIMIGGQALMTTTIEEKSNRVVEVLLAAVSPFELMAGKIVGQMGVSLIVLGLYAGIGIAVLLSFALFGLLDMWLVFYLVVFFVIAYLVNASLMVAVGAAVNEMKEAQALMMPIVLVLMAPWILTQPIAREPNSTFSTVLSFVPPLNPFCMLIRLASTAPPPLWQVWLSIAIGVASVFAAVWFAAKVFRIGLLMYGKPPDFATLIRWARAA